MITKEQAIALGNGTLGSRSGETMIHCEVVRKCKKTIGPRGGEKNAVVKVRVTGKCKTWVTRPEAFRLPVKHGMYESGAITESNAAAFHLSNDCPAGIK